MLVPKQPEIEYYDVGAKQSEIEYMMLVPKQPENEYYDVGA